MNDYANRTTLPKASDIAERFALGGPVVDLAVLGSGNVNDTFLLNVTPKESGDGPRPIERYVLQRVNRRIFPQPELITHNVRLLLDHAEWANPVPGCEHLHFPAIVPTHDGHDYALDGSGDFWRCQRFVENAATHPEVTSDAHAFQVGQALGWFHRTASGIDIGRLHDTLLGFHVTPGYLDAYDRALPMSRRRVSDGAAASCVEFVAERRAGCSILEDAFGRGELQTTPIHGDPKVDNVLIDTTTQRAVSIVDLDTFKPGLVHYDIGDCLRSSCNRLGDETDRFGEVEFDVDLCRTILSGYLPIAGESLSAADYAYLYASIRLIAFELGLRFFTDYLDGDVYFKVTDAEHNLRRALVQFELTRSIEAQQDHIESAIAETRLRHR